MRSIFFLASFAVLGSACSSESGRCSWGLCPDAASDTSRDATGTDGMLDATTDVVPDSPTRVVSLAITPTDPVLISEGGALPAVRFMVTGTTASGDMVDVSDRLRFSLADNTIGTIDNTGLFVSTGPLGHTTVHVQLVDSASVNTSTSVAVHRHDLLIAAGTPTDAPDQFAAATPGSGAPPAFAYPLADAVMPRNVPSPVIQWNPGGTEDGTELYHIRLGRPDAVIDAFVSASSIGFNDAFQPDAMTWRAFAESDVGTPINLTLEVLHGGTLRAASPLTFRTVDAIAAGSVYYWQLPAPGAPSMMGRVMRLDTETAARTDFLPAGQCHGCHAVSQDGTQMTNSSGGWDLTTTPVRNLFPNAAFIDGRSYNPAGTRIVQSGLVLLDAHNGSTVTSSGLPSGGVYPEWSRDGSFIAYVTGRDASPAGEYGGTADLLTAPVLAGDQFGPPVTVHTGASLPNGGRDWHPTISPNSRWIAFQHGDNARSTGNGALFLIARDGGTPVALAQANGASLDSYRPHFSPIDSGGYFWLVFSSSRPYGNARAGVIDGSRNQLWVTAVRDHPDGTTDPSEVPYWLPGQNVQQYNLSAYWAPAPCRMNGMGCSSGDECCSTQCEPDSSGTDSCVPPMDHCAMRGESCGSSTDCCTGAEVLVCNDAHVCDLPPPG